MLESRAHAALTNVVNNRVTGVSGPIDVVPQVRTAESPVTGGVITRVAH